MENKVYYFEDTEEITKVLVTIGNAIPCFMRPSIIEMGWIEVSIQCRAEDLAYVENMLAPFI